MTLTFRSLTLLIGLAVVAIAGGCQQPMSPPAPAMVVEFDASDFTFNAPDMLPAGLVTLRMSNHGQEPHHGQLLRLNDGVTTDQFLATLARGAEAEAQAMVSIEGGPGLIDPHGTSEVSLDLQPGAYILACFIPSADGVPHLAKGMLKPLQVMAGYNTATAPRTAGSFTARDFSIDMPDTLPSGRATYQVTNMGPQPHEIGIVKLSAGASAADVLAFYKNPAGMPPFQSVGGINGLGVGKSGFMTLDLQPGTYAAVCLIPDPASMVPHLHLGMIKSFTVKG